EDFGVVAKAIAITGIVELIFIHGLFGSIVRSDSLDNDQLNYLFIFSLIISLIITSLLFISAKPISAFYEDDRIIWVVRIAALSILVSGINTVFNALLTREMRFKQLAIINITATVFASSLTLFLALLDFGYKALMYQVLVLNIFLTLGSIFYSKWKPGIRISSKGLKQHLIFGSNMLVNNLLNYGARNVDNIAIGKLQSTLELGYYSRAYHLMLLPVGQIDQIINSTLFPALSKIKSEKQRMLSVLNQIQEFVLVIIYPLVIWLFFNIDFFITNILGQTWEPSATYFKIFTPLILVQIFTGQIKTIYMTLNKVGILIKISLYTKPILMGMLVLSAFYGALYVGVALTVISSLFGFYIYFKGINLLGSASMIDHVNFLKSTFQLLLIFISGQVFLCIVFKVHEILFLTSLISLVACYTYILKTRIEIRNKLFQLLKLDKYRVS
ncbi:MAG: oligosaccharide flippase family protein, partial [Bacteroidota bacterium]